jgi:hypothetical protein
MTPDEIAAVEADVQANAQKLFPRPSKAAAKVRATFVRLHLPLALLRAEQDLRLVEQRRAMKNLRASRRREDGKMGDLENLLIRKWGVSPVVRELPIATRDEAVAIHRAMNNHAGDTGFPWFARTISDGRRKGATLRVVAVSEDAMALAMLFHR